jgi:hypothetical protein
MNVIILRNICNKYLKHQFIKKKERTIENTYKNYLYENKEKYLNCKEIYSNASKSEKGVDIAVTTKKQTTKPHHFSQK